MDCFYVGRLSGTRGVVLAVHRAGRLLELPVGRASRHAEKPLGPLRLAARPPGGRGPARPRVGARGRLHDNASEFTSAEFARALAARGARQRRIHAGRPQSNGAVERVQLSVLDECWRPAFARYLIPTLTGLRRELARYVRYYNADRAHTGRITRGRTPEQVLGKAKMWTPRA